MKQRQRSRNVALTMLVDVLVQIVFVFTLLLVAAGALYGGKESRFHIPLEAWKTLVNVFDVDPKRDASSQAQTISERYQKLKGELEAFKTALRDSENLRKTLERENGDLKRGIAELKEKTRKLETDNQNLRATIRDLDRELEEAKGGAPGFPPCRASDGSVLLVLSARIDRRGLISVRVFPGANAEGLSVDEASIAGRLSRQAFRDSFGAWNAHGLKRSPRCKYTAHVQYDPQSTARDYQPALSAIWTLFKVARIQPARGDN